MKKDDFLKMMNGVDDELLMRAENSDAPRISRGAWIKWGVIAAVICLIAVSVIATVILSREDGSVNGDTDTVEDVLQVSMSELFWFDTRERNGKKVAYNLGETVVEIPWDQRDVYVQYTEMVMNGEKYRSRNSSYYGDQVFANKIGEKLADADCSGFNNMDGKTYTAKCEVFAIVGVDSERIVAVKYWGHDGYYPFIKDENQAPDTLGELIDSLDLTENIKLNDFYYDQDGDTSEEHFMLSDENSEALWNILKEYISAPAVLKDVYAGSNKAISFAIYSKTLGVNNLSFSFSQDGYLWTNIENYAYIYNIGKDAVSKIIDVAVKNRLIVLGPTKQYLVGTVTEVGADYIKVDDSILMKNPEEGIEFTVYATNMHLKGLLKIGSVRVGDIVGIEHGPLMNNAHTEIKNAVNISDCMISSDGEVLIPE